MRLLIRAEFEEAAEKPLWLSQDALKMVIGGYPLRPNRLISFRISCSTVIPPWEFSASPETREAKPAAHISNFHQMGNDTA